MIFYHGSKLIIDSPVAHGSNPNNDYGASFYTTLDLDSAKEWACKNDELGLVNKYQIRKSEFESLRILDLTNREEFNVLNWLAILMHYRDLDMRTKHLYQSRLNWLERFYIDVEQFDIIKGFRADDSYFAFPLAFLLGQLSLERLQNVFMLGQLGVQYAFNSKRAIKLLKFVSFENIETKYIGKHYQRIKKATEEYRNILNTPINENETFITDLMKKYE